MTVDPPLSKHNPDGRQLAQQMLEKSKQNNNIRTTLDDLRELTMRIYQIKQAPLYTREHLGEESGLYELHLVRANRILFVAKSSRGTQIQPYIPSGLNIIQIQ